MDDGWLRTQVIANQRRGETVSKLRWRLLVGAKHSCYVFVTRKESPWLVLKCSC